jgi:hypothetical protein
MIGINTHYGNSKKISFYDLVRIQAPSSVRAVDKTPLFAALIRTFFIFIPFANEFATALNEKCPPQSGRHFVRVTQGVDKSNFYGDLERVGD